MHKVFKDSAAKIITIQHQEDIECTLTKTDSFQLGTTHLNKQPVITQYIITITSDISSPAQLNTLTATLTQQIWFTHTCTCVTKKIQKLPEAQNLNQFLHTYFCASFTALCQEHTCSKQPEQLTMGYDPRQTARGRLERRGFENYTETLCLLLIHCCWPFYPRHNLYACSAYHIQAI